ncbi:Mob1/phocein family protein [Ancylostoma duodenale]|uniref:Mob1/phocein family protein n=1 Tax=Ancylostoma duodenale TaxID=51022 RepID=A0A0C2H1S2_9BILA|nr:Mob1/phocein family protein [Ancylostoma duodenale]
MSALRSGVRGAQHANNDNESMIQTAPTLGSGNLHDVVRLPNGEDLNEWLAVNMLFSPMRGCFSLPCSAPVYIDYVMTWVQDQLDDECVFPSQVGRSFPRNFIEVCEGIMRRLFRVYAHVYASHATRFSELNATPHLNTSFKQFILFARQFQLIPTRELEPLRGKIDELIGTA